MVRAFEKGSELWPEVVRVHQPLQHVRVPGIELLGRVGRVRATDVEGGPQGAHSPRHSPRSLRLLSLACDSLAAGPRSTSGSAVGAVVGRGATAASSRGGPRAQTSCCFHQRAAHVAGRVHLAAREVLDKGGGRHLRFVHNRVPRAERGGAGRLGHRTRRLEHRHGRHRQHLCVEAHHGGVGPRTPFLGAAEQFHDDRGRLVQHRLVAFPDLADLGAGHGGLRHTHPEACAPLTFFFGQSPTLSGLCRTGAHG